VPLCDLELDRVTEILPPNSQRARALPWPEDVPVLVAGDMTEYDEPDKVGSRRALWVWYRETFPSGNKTDPEDPLEMMRDIVFNEIGLLIAEATSNIQKHGSLYEWSREHTKAEAAQFWNDLMRRLGYDIPEPEEAKPKKKRKEKS